VLPSSSLFTADPLRLVWKCLRVEPLVNDVKFCEVGHFVVLRIIVYNNEMAQLSTRGSTFNSDWIFMIFTDLLIFMGLKLVN